ncbi:hypothetical protein QUB70_05685 [Microcoleus sp. A003_D6]
MSSSACCHAIGLVILGFIYQDSKKENQSINFPALGAYLWDIRRKMLNLVVAQFKSQPSTATVKAVLGLKAKNG